MIVDDFVHVHCAHCESGAVAGLVRHGGLPMSEAMAFGVSSTLTFAFLPFLKMGSCPLTAYRRPPGRIVRMARKRLDLPLVCTKHRSPDEAMDALDVLLDQGHVVGLQTSVYWLPYFPEHMRFHFNAHNVLAVGREGDEYILSDPVIEHLVRCSRDDLAKARFATGVFAPKGRSYHLSGPVGEVDLDGAIRTAVRATAKEMVKTPVPVIGVRGQRWVARYVRKLPRKFRDDPRRARLVLGSIVRMQEEIGTGGAGFRFLYASFLQEAAERLGSERLAEASRRMTVAGDALRDFALHAVRAIKRDATDYGEAADALRLASDLEAEAHRLVLDA